MDTWQKNGFLKISGFFTPEDISFCKEWISEIQQWPDDKERWMHHYETTPVGVRLSRTENVVPYHKPLRDFLTRGKVIDAISALLGEPAVLYKEKINYKYPGGGSYAAHQDAPAYHPVSRHVTCLIAIDPVTKDNGCLYFSPYPEGHVLLPLDEKGCIPEKRADEMEWEPAESNPADIWFFHSYTPHWSGPNHTDQARRILYVTYNALSEGDLREAYYADKREKLKRNTERISLIGHFRGSTVVKS